MMIWAGSSSTYIDDEGNVIETPWEDKTEALEEVLRECSPWVLDVLEDSSEPES